MTSKVTNADLYGVLLEIKEDIGGLKTSASMQLEGLKNHAGRLVNLEDSVSKQKGASKVWAMVSSGIGAVAGGLVAAFWQAKT